MRNGSQLQISKEDREQRLLLQFLKDEMKFEILGFQGTRPPKPDAQAEVSLDGARRMIDIEMTEYQVDASLAEGDRQACGSIRLGKKSKITSYRP